MLKIGDKVRKPLTALYTDGPSTAKGTARPKFWGTGSGSIRQAGSTWPPSR